MKKVLIVLICLCFCGRVNSNPECREIRVALIGDSIMSDDFFGEIFKDLAIDEPEGLRFEVQNLSEKGADMEDIYRQFLTSLVFFKPTHVVIYGGINDCMRDKGTKAKAGYITRIMDWIVQLCKSLKIVPIIVKHHPWKGYDNFKAERKFECSIIVNKWIDGEFFYGSEIRIVNTAFLSACGWDEKCNMVNPKCPCQYYLDGVCDAGDGLHLNSAGKGILAKVIFDEVSW